MTHKYENTKWMKIPEDLKDHPVVKGYDFSKQFNIKTFLDSFATTGMQATNLGMGLEIINQMIHEEAKIILSFTGNVISSGMHESIIYLVKNKMVDCIVTSGAGIEEDIIKSEHSFKIGKFDVAGRMLFDRGVGRIGNIFVPVDRYAFLEKKLHPIFKKLYSKNKVVKPSEFCKTIGKELNENSFLFWAQKNNIPIFSPAIIDGSLGDIAYFFHQKNSDFVFDPLGDSKEIISFGLNNEKVGAVILGGGVSKHYALNSMIFREGLDYVVYVTTAQEFDGSDSGGNPEEAITWAKLKVNAPYAKIICDFTIAMPLIMLSWIHTKKL